MTTIFTMPAEWEKHKGCFLGWPYDLTTFGERLSRVEKAFVDIIKALSVSEHVYLLVNGNEMEKKVHAMLASNAIDLDTITFIQADYADVWLRDYGPMFVRTDIGMLSWIKWKYNAYGEKFPDLFKDDAVFDNIGDNIGLPKISVPLFMEGGALEINGKGTLVTTEQCLLNPNRNPTYSKEQIEDILKQYLGVTNIIWLQNGITNDHTDGHIDDMVKFVDAHTIVCAYEEDQTDSNFKILDDAYTKLQGAKDQDGNAFIIIKIPMPHMNYDDGEKSPVSYANFYIGNTIVLVPTYNDPNDSFALEIIGGLFPDKKTIGIDCTDIIYGGGAIHCITQQWPEL